MASQCYQPNYKYHNWSQGTHTTTSSTSLRVFLLARMDPRYSEAERLYRDVLSTNQSQIQQLLQLDTPEVRAFREAFLNDFVHSLPRLTLFVRNAKASAASPENVLIRNRSTSAGRGGGGNHVLDFPQALCDHVMLVLMSQKEEPGLIDSPQFVELAVAILDIYITLAKYAQVSLKPLRTAFENILQIPASIPLFERILVHENGGQVFNNFLCDKGTFDKVFTEKLQLSSIKRMASLSSRCIVNHGTEVSSALQQWHELECLQIALTAAVQEHESRNTSSDGVRKGFNSLGHFLPFKDVAIIKVKDGTIREPVGPNFSLDEYTQHRIQDLGLKKPRSVGETLNLQSEIVKKFYFSILQVLASGFPCNSCFVHSSDQTALAINITTEKILKSTLTDLPIGPFPLHLSTIAFKDLTHSRAAGTFHAIAKKLQGLANGEWELYDTLSMLPANRKQSAKEPQLRVARWSDNGRILWERGVARMQDGTGGWIQIVKIWRIAVVKDINLAGPSVTKAHKTYSKAYIKASSLKLKEDGNNGRLLPLVFTQEVAVEFDSKHIFDGAVAPVGGGGKEKKLTEAEGLILHNALVTGKFFTITQTVLDSILYGGTAAEFEFNVSEEEESIIRHTQSSICILGRSGTGKTTCLVFRLLGGYFGRRIVGGNTTGVRQVFLTRSPILAGKIRQYVKKLIDSQLCRFSDYISTEDALIDNFGETVEDMELDVNVDEKDILSMTDQDWPLVCTFETFFSMVERSLRVVDRRVFIKDGYESDATKAAKHVDFAKFRRNYWPTFPTTAKKGYSVDLVFAEIMGVIKATTNVANHKPLTKAEYIELSSRLAPTFCLTADRSAVYSLFEAYEQRKHQLGEWDDVDRGIELRQVLDKDKGLSKRIKDLVTEAFVDEVQDQRLPELEFIMELVQNPRGLALAGDTAQCISRDSTFRFQDIKRLFYETYGGIAEAANDETLAKPFLASLTTNYRSHNGILKLAAEIIGLLWKTFPDVIDKLTPEVGKFSGPKPTVFAGFASEILVTRRKDDSEISISDFGAEQVILVRDDDCKALLEEEIGTESLILTVLESKGMEFEDVLIYNYFTWSHADTSFRALAEAKTGKKNFDPMKHALLCAELKGLYVAVTRPKANLWIIEQDADVCAPFIEMWGSAAEDSLVEIARPTDLDIEIRVQDLRAGKSSPDEWSKKGEEFMDRKLYLAAFQCYRKAGDHERQKLSLACISYTEAQDLFSTSNDKARHKYIEAAKLFLDLEKPFWRRALRCYEAIKDYHLAGDLCKQLNKHEFAAKYYLRGELWELAANEYHTMRRYEDAMMAYRSGDKIEGLIRYLKTNQAVIPVLAFSRTSRIVLIRLQTLTYVEPKLRTMAISFLDDKEQERLLKQLNMRQELIKFYHDRKKYSDVLKIYAAKGEWAKLHETLKTMSKQHVPFEEIPEESLREYVDRIQMLKFTVAIQRFIQRPWPDSTKLDKRAQNLVKLISVEGITPATRLLEKWKTLPTLATSWFIMGVQPDQSKLPRALNEEEVLLMDLTILQNAKSLGKGASSMHNLPLNSVARCSELLQTLYKAKQRKLTPVLALFFHLLPISGDGGIFQTMDTSPLWDHLTTDSREKEVEQSLVQNIIFALAEWIAVAAFHFSEIGKTIYTSLASCEVYLAKQSCLGQKTGACTKSHKIITKDDFRGTVELCWAVGRIVTLVSFAYFKRIMGEETARRYRAESNYWFDEILKSTTFISDQKQDPLAKLKFAALRNPRASVDVSREVVRQQKVDMNLFTEIDKYIFFRLQKIRHNSLSVLLEKYFQVSDIGMTSYFIQEWAHYTSWNAPLPVWEILFHIKETDDLLLESEVEYHAQAFEILDKVCLKVTQLPNTEFSYIHSIITWAERLTTVLIAVNNPQEFLAKDSWCIHLSTCFSLPNVINANLKSVVKQALTSMLKMLNHLYTNIAESVRERPFLERRHGVWPEFVVPRILEAMAIVLLNTSDIDIATSRLCIEAWKHSLKFFPNMNKTRQQTGFHNIPAFSTIRDTKTFMNWFLITWKDFSPMDRLMIFARKSVMHSFGKFHGYSVARTVINGINNPRNYPVHKSIEKLRATFEAFQKSAAKTEEAEKNASISRKSKDSTQPKTEKKRYSPLETAAAMSIQKLWRKKWLELKQRRQLYSTIYGRAVPHARQLLNSYRNDSFDEYKITDTCFTIAVVELYVWCEGVPSLQKNLADHLNSFCNERMDVLDEVERFLDISSALDNRYQTIKAILELGETARNRSARELVQTYSRQVRCCTALVAEYKGVIDEARKVFARS